MFVDLSADWCPYCRQMDKNVLHDPQVIDFLGQYITVRLDYDSEFGQSLKRRYSISGVPCIMLFDSTGQLRGKLDGAPSSSAGFIQYVTEFSKSDGNQFRQDNAVGVQAPSTAQPAWLQPQTTQSNTWSNRQALPFPAAQTSGQAPFPAVQSNGTTWTQTQPNSWLSQPPSQIPAQQYPGTQTPSQYPPQQYPGTQTPSQYPPQQYQGTQQNAGGQVNLNPWPPQIPRSPVSNQRSPQAPTPQQTWQPQQQQQ